MSVREEKKIKEGKESECLWGKTKKIKEKKNSEVCVRKKEGEIEMSEKN